MTNKEVLNNMLRRTFPKTIFIYNNADYESETLGINFSKEWLNSEYMDCGGDAVAQFDHDICFECENYNKCKEQYDILMECLEKEKKMNDYIMNRESLKRHCEAMCKKFKDVPTSGAYSEHRLVLDLLEQTEWIPVSERLPEEYKTVIASVEYGVYPEARYSKEYGWEWAYESGADYWKELAGVTAWMPLPKRYKSTEDKNDN